MRYVLLFLLLTPLTIKAQRTFRAGLQAGINACQIHGDNNWGFHQAGPVGGAFVCTDPTQKWYGQMELQFSRKGSRKLTNPNVGDYTSFEYRLSYVEVPLLLRYNMGKLYAEIGGSVGFLVKARQWDSYSEIPAQDFRKWETAFIAGLGYTINDKLVVDFRSSNSILPVLKFPQPAYYPRFIPNLFNRGMYNNILGLTLSYRFGGAKGGE